MGEIDHSLAAKPSPNASVCSSVTAAALFSTLTMAHGTVACHEAGKAIDERTKEIEGSSHGDDSYSSLTVHHHDAEITTHASMSAVFGGFGFVSALITASIIKSMCAGRQR